MAVVLLGMFLLPVLIRKIKNAFSSRGAVAAALLLVFCASQSSRAAEAGLSSVPGNKIWVFAVSVLEFREKSSYASFPKKDRRDAALVRHFIQERGVPQSQVVWLKDSKAKLPAIRSAFREMLGRTRKGDLLFLYYTGHGDREKPGVTFFIPYDSASDNTARTAWSAPEIIKDIEDRFRGDRAILAADCCHSGGICRQAAEAGRRVSYACLASAQSSSESTGEWTFSDNLLRGLRGASRADADGDGRISMGELADSAETELAFAEGQLSASAATGLFSRDWVLAAVSRREPQPEAVLVRGEDGEEQKGFSGSVCAAKEGPGRKVAYSGESADSCVVLARIRPYHPPSPAYQRGAVVYAEWEKTWYKATVEDFRLGLTHISYDGFGSYWDEWVPAERLRGAAPCGPVPCSVP